MDGFESLEGNNGIVMKINYAAIVYCLWLFKITFSPLSCLKRKKEINMFYSTI